MDTLYLLVSFNDQKFSLSLVKFEKLSTIHLMKSSEREALPAPSLVQSLCYIKEHAPLIAMSVITIIPSSFNCGSYFNDAASTRRRKTNKR